MPQCIKGVGDVSMDMCRLAQEIIAGLELFMVSTPARYILGNYNILAG